MSTPSRRFFKDAVAFFNVGKRAAVSNERRGIDLALLDRQTQGFGAVAAIHPTGFENQVFAVHIGQRQRLRAVVEGYDGHGGVGPGTGPCHAEGIRRAGHLQHRVRSAMVGMLTHKGFQRFRRRGEHLRVVAAHEGQAQWVCVAYDHTARMLEQYALQRT